MMSYPVLVSALTVLLIFLIGRRISGNVGGFFAATMAAVNAAFLSRTTYGRADSDGWVIFFSVLVVWAFLESFAAGREYEISLTDDICNCSGTKLDKNTLQFRVSSIPVRDGILISEVLSDPEPGRREFIEIVNRSGNVIDLRDYRLNIDDPSVTANIITNEYWPLAAGEYAIITGGYDGIDSEYNFDSPEKIICMPGMPRLPNDGATVYLLDQAGEIADRIIYSPEWHHEILREVKGVSLERISMTRPPGRF